MSEIDLRYLEGSAAIGDQMRAHTGKPPDPEQVEFAQSCMLHGRLFWESASRATLETRPLLLYYGAAAFAKALISVLSGCRPADFESSHGLSGRPAASGQIRDFMVMATARRPGLFQRFNDAVAGLNRVQYYDHDHGSWQSRPCSTAASDRLSGFKVTLLDCFARVPALQEHFQMCTQQEPKSLSLVFTDYRFARPMRYQIRVDVPKPYDGRDALRDIVTSVRTKAPFLAQWGLATATVQDGSTVLHFENIAPAPDEFESLIAAPPFMHRPEVIGMGYPFDALDSLPPLAGGFSQAAHATYIEPIDGEYVSEFSMSLATLLGLSSLVRYHPHTWTACVHRRPLAGRPVDDMLLPVIETFLSDVALRFPQFVADAILGR